MNDRTIPTTPTSDEKLRRYMESIIHNMVAANQAAWIEWKTGDGAEAAMQRVQNGLMGPGHIPLMTGESADEWYIENKVPVAPCYCKEANQ